MYCTVCTVGKVSLSDHDLPCCTLQQCRKLAFRTRRHDGSAMMPVRYCTVHGSTVHTLQYCTERTLRRYHMMGKKRKKIPKGKAAGESLIGWEMDGLSRCRSLLLPWSPLFSLPDPPRSIGRRAGGICSRIRPTRNPQISSPQPMVSRSLSFICLLEKTRNNLSRNSSLQATGRSSQSPSPSPSLLLLALCS